MVIDNGEGVSRPRECLEELKAEFMKCGDVWRVVLILEKG